MTRSKLLAIMTGAISILLALGYLLLVQILDFRGEMLPAPVSYHEGAGSPSLVTITVTRSNPWQSMSFVH